MDYGASPGYRYSASKERLKSQFSNSISGEFNMITIIAAALASAQPAVVQTAAPAPHSQMGQAGPKKEECCCCKDKRDKEHAGQDLDRMHDHHDHGSR
jgi:hypothetical protein